MNKIISSILLSFLSLAAFSQNIEGVWQLTSFNESKETKFEDFSNCFWCQLPEENQSFEIKGDELIANLNGERITYDIEIEDNLLTLIKSQTVYISTFGQNTEMKKITGKTYYEFEKKDNILMLKDYDSSTENTYTFQLN